MIVLCDTATCTSVTVSRLGEPLDGTYTNTPSPTWDHYYYRAGGSDTYTLYYQSSGERWYIQNDGMDYQYVVSHGDLEVPCASYGCRFIRRIRRAQTKPFATHAIRPCPSDSRLFILSHEATTCDDIQRRNCQTSWRNRAVQKRCFLLWCAGVGDET